MASRSLSDVADLASKNIDQFAWSIGSIVLYGESEQWRAVCEAIDDFCRDAGSDGTPRLAVLLPQGGGKTTIASGVERKLRTTRTVRVVEDGLTASWGELRTMAPRADVCFVIDGLPDSLEQRRQSFSRMREIRGPLLVLSDPAYRADEGLGAVDRLELPHIDARPSDKVCLLLGMIWEEARANDGDAPQAAALVGRLPLRVLATVCEGMPFGRRYSEIGRVARALVERLLITAQDGGELEAEAFIEICSPVLRDREITPANSYRVWVEGETDVRIFEIAARLAMDRGAPDLWRGFAILATGVGRDGGAGQATSVVAREATQANRDLFVLDNDPRGRAAKEKLEALNQKVLLLHDAFLRKHRATDDNVEVEIEDLVSVECLDRFFEARTDLSPEFEALFYANPRVRRLVVRGADKEPFVQWLETNATFEDVERVVFVLCEICHHFGLGALKPKSDMRAWRDAICDPGHSSSRAGRRPAPWWYVVQAKS